MQCSVENRQFDLCVKLQVLCLINFTGTKAYEKVNSLLMSTRLLGDIKKLSPDAQTSCLEGFHATLNHRHPKMVCFSWMGTLCRYLENWLLS